MHESLPDNVSFGLDNLKFLEIVGEVTESSTNKQQISSGRFGGEGFWARDYGGGGRVGRTFGAR